MQEVVIIGCGVIGAMIAYELSQIPGLKVRVLEKQQPAGGSTSAALGVLMGVISEKIKGRNWQLRLASLQRYETLVPELEQLTGYTIPYNRHGILMLCFNQEELAKKTQLREKRKTQGLELEILELDSLKTQFPYLNYQHICGAVYSPQDRQIDPVKLTKALIAAAQKNGVIFSWETPVQSFNFNQQINRLEIETKTDKITADWLVIAAGLGSFGLQNHIKIEPVLGQALLLQLPELMTKNIEPVITGNDVHIVPVGNNNYWIGATVEFSETANQDLLEQVLQQASQICPPLQKGQIMRQWFGLRPRPQGQPAPVIEALSEYPNVLLATGHYRNGILLAPGTAQAIRQMIISAAG